MASVSGSDLAACAEDAAALRTIRKQLTRRDERLAEKDEEIHTLNQTVLDMHHTIGSQNKNMVTLKAEHRRLTFFFGVTNCVARNDAIRNNERILVWPPKGWCQKAVDTTARKAMFSRLHAVRDHILETSYDNCPDPESSDWINYLCKSQLGVRAYQECIKKNRTCMIRAPGKEDVYRPAV